MKELGEAEITFDIADVAGIASELAVGAGIGKAAIKGVKYGANVVKGKTMSGSTIYNGDISSNGRYSLEAHSGKVEMTIPSNSAFDLSASTFSGSIKTDFKVVMSGTLSKKKISGSVNGGGAKVRLKHSVAAFI